MNDWTAGQIRELLAAMLDAERRHRDVLRAEDQRGLEEYKAQLNRAVELKETGIGADKIYAAHHNALIVSIISMAISMVAIALTVFHR